VIAGIAHVGARVLAGLVYMEGSRGFHFLQNSRQRAPGLRAAHENLSTLNAANHIQVQHRHGFIGGERRMIDVPVAAEQSQFLPGESEEQNSALGLLLLGEPTRQFNHAGSSGRVIVGSRMHHLHLIGRQRMFIA